MQTLLIGINSKYIHPAYAVYQLVANAIEPVSFKEFTIKDSISEMTDFILQSNPDLLGISTYIYNVKAVKSLLTSLEDAKFKGKIILGGPEVSYQAEHFFKYHAIDFIIRNEGEEAFNLLLLALQGKTDLSSVPNLVYKIGTKLHYTKLKECDLSKIKPAHHLLEDKENRIVYFEASRGCPFKCAYCMASLEKSVRFFKEAQTKSELLQLLKSNVKTIKFLDRSFNINAKYTHDLFTFLKEHDNNYTTIQFEVVLDLFKQEEINFILHNIRRDYFRFEVGIQSINTRTTDSVNRYQNWDKIKENHRLLKGHVTMHLDLIAGLPYEDLNSFMHTFNETILLFPDELQLGFLKELKGTQISKTKEVHHYVFDSQAPYEVLSNSYISSKELDAIRLVEDILEKYYNSNRFNRAICYLFETLKLAPFETYHEFALYLQRKNISLFRYQLHELFQYLFDFLVSLPNVNHAFLLFLLKQDYLTFFKNRPKIWWEKENRTDRNAIYQTLHETYNESLDTLFRYAHFETYLDQSFIIIYEPNHIRTYNL